MWLHHIWLADTPILPPIGIGIGINCFLIISLLVIILAQKFSSNDRSKPVPDDYDNRWVGYPLYPGDDGYDPLTKGKFGKLPKTVLERQDDGTSIWVHVAST